MAPGRYLMGHLVSILIPAFNAEKWIDACIRSALAQTWIRKEIVIVDDGSSDKTLEIARSYASQTTQVISQENRGASASRNRALSLAQGDYIQWLDADDLLAPDKIALQLKETLPEQDERVLLSCAWGRFYQWPELSKFRADPLWEDLEPKEWLFRKLDQNLWMPIMSWLVSRELTEMAGPWNETLSLDDDGEYFCRVLANSHGVRFIREAMCFNRITNGLSSTITLNSKKQQSQLTSLQSYIRTLRNMEDSPRTRDACLRLLNRWTIFFDSGRGELIPEMQDMALELGRPLDPVKLRSKYRWLKRIIGRDFAVRTQFALPLFRFYYEKTRERMRYLLSS